MSAADVVRNPTFDPCIDFGIEDIKPKVENPRTLSKSPMPVQEHGFLVHFGAGLILDKIAWCTTFLPEAVLVIRVSTRVFIRYKIGDSNEICR